MPITANLHMPLLSTFLRLYIPCTMSYLEQMQKRVCEVDVSYLLGADDSFRSRLSGVLATSLARRMKKMGNPDLMGGCDAFLTQPMSILAAGYLPALLIGP